MSRKQASRRFAADNRAVSAVIGFILIFGILVLLLTVYQAQIVPQQNAQTEFEHFEDNKNEMIELRNAISTAGQADVSQFPSVTLGTSYQTRLLTINPAPPVGTLQTSESYNITIANETHQTNVSSKFLVYEPGYNELQIGSTTYEHSVLYLDERDRENNVSIVEDQNLVKDGKVRITALQNSFQQQGTNRITLELYPQDELSDGDGDFPDGDDLNVTIPTQLDADEYWDDELADKSVYDGVDIDARDEGVHTLNLSVDEDNLKVNSVGIQLEPDEDPAKNTDPQERDNDNNGPEITEFESVSVSNINEDQSSEEQTFEFSLDGDLEDGETVTVDLPQDNQEVDYQDSTATVSQGSGEADAERPNANEAFIEYTSEGDSSGETISIELDEIDTSDEISGNDYDVVFDYEQDEDNDIDETTSFEVEED